MQKPSPDIIIRPSGVWDTRAPLFHFLTLHRQENEIYHALTLGINHLMRETSQRDLNSDAREMLLGENEKYPQRRAWGSYIESFQNPASGKERPHPRIGDFQRSLESSRSSITEYAIVSYFGVFETYMRCWALNFLLAKLENEDKGIGDPWTPAERNLANSFSPLKKGPIPNFVGIYKAIPVVESNLRQLPHIFFDPKNGKLVETPITSQLTAFQTIEFWREWRNLLVHSSGIVNAAFYNKHKDFWRDFKSVFPAMSDFEKGRRLILNDWTFRAMTTVHHRAAKSLRNILVEISHERRGHAHAPGPEKKKYGPEDIPGHLPGLLIPEDHDYSYKWATDEKFQMEWRKSWVKNEKKIA